MFETDPVSEVLNNLRPGKREASSESSGLFLPLLLA